MVYTPVGLSERIHATGPRVVEPAVVHREKRRRKRREPIYGVRAEHVLQLLKNSGVQLPLVSQRHSRQRIRLNIVNTANVMSYYHQTMVKRKRPNRLSNRI